MLRWLSGLSTPSSLWKPVPPPIFAILSTIVWIGSIRNSAKQDLMSSVWDVAYLVGHGVILMTFSLDSPLRWGWRPGQSQYQRDPPPHHLLAPHQLSYGLDYILCCLPLLTPQHLKEALYIRAEWMVLYMTKTMLWLFMTMTTFP